MLTLFLIALGICVLILALSALFCWETFGIKYQRDPHYLSAGRQYKSCAQTFHELVNKLETLPYEDVFVQYEDNIRLHGRFYMVNPKAPVDIQFHGYRSCGLRDLCGGANLALERGHNVLLVDQRAHGQSQGKFLTMGVKERYDCMAWIDYVRQRFSDDTSILLVGVSMGAATVLMTANLGLPKCVKGIIADCGYTSPEAIIKNELKTMHIPQKLGYFLVRTGARIFAGFDPSSASAEEALKTCPVPVLFIHGEADRYVPCEMSRQNYWACTAPKKLLTIPGAVHGMSYLVDPVSYRAAVSEFMTQVLHEEPV